MSAYLMSNFEISAFAAHIRHHRLHRGILPETANERDIAKVLYEENVKSLTARYGEEDHPKFRFISSAYVAHFKPVQWIKGAQCLQYQSCEHKDYYESDAYKLTQRLISHNINRLSGYEEAHWGLPEPKDTGEIIPIGL